MPVELPEDFPAVIELRREGIDIIQQNANGFDNSKQLRIGILNLMPIKEDAERDLLRLLYDNPYAVKVTFVELSTYRGSHTSSSHLDRCYVKWTQIKHRKFDGFIITGAPVEGLAFEDVAYWEELEDIMEWCRTNVKSTLFICWGALAALYHFYGVRKILFEEKLSGVYSHRSIANEPLTKNLGQKYYIPHSRFASPDAEDIARIEALKVFSYSDEAGIYGLMTEKGNEIYLTGHIEYSSSTLHEEYERDIKKGLNPRIPVNYYIDDVPGNGLRFSWLQVAKTLFSNWMMYYVDGPKVIGLKS